MPRVLPSLPTSVEERISGWIRIQERLAAQAGKLARPRAPRLTLTLSRQFGCEGFPVALCLQARLEARGGGPWTIFDRALLDQLAADEGLARRVLTGGEPEASAGLGFQPWDGLSADAAFAKLARCLVKVARVGNAIIVGRGGALVCRDLPNAFHFRLVAAFSWRVASLARRSGLSWDEAAERVRTLGEARNRFIRGILHADPEDPLNYDAVFNNQRHSAETLAAAMCACLPAPEELTR